MCQNLVKKEKYVTRGMPQGTCLGPILFNVFTNDIKDLQLNGMSFRFADDFLILWQHSSHDDEVSRKYLQQPTRYLGIL